MTVIQETKVELLREKNIKSMECANKATGFENSDFSAPIGVTPSERAEALKTAHNDDSEHPSTDWLNERHCQDTERIGKLERELRQLDKERLAEIERGDNWRTKYRAADAETGKRDIEIRNLKFEIEKMNKLLESAYANDKLMDGVMRLYLETKDKLNESVEGEVMDKWR